MDIPAFGAPAARSLQAPKSALTRERWDKMTRCSFLGKCLIINEAANKKCKKWCRNGAKMVQFFECKNPDANDVFIAETID